MYVTGKVRDTRKVESKEERILTEHRKLDVSHKSEKGLCEIFLYGPCSVVGNTSSLQDGVGVRIPHVSTRYNETKFIMETLKQIVKGSAVLDSIRGGGVASYIVTSENNKRYLLDIDLSNKKDVGDGVFKREEKAIYLMRWIRKAMEKGELIEL